MIRARRDPVETVRFVTITEHDGSTAHRVAHEQAAALLHGRSVQGLCGRVFVPAAMSAPDGMPCRLCAELFVNQQRTGSGYARDRIPFVASSRR